MLAHHMLNDAFSGIDLIIVWLNVLGAVLSAWWNFKSAKISPQPWHKIKNMLTLLT